VRAYVCVNVCVCVCVSVVYAKQNDSRSAVAQIIITGTAQLQFTTFRDIYWEMAYSVHTFGQCVVKYYDKILLGVWCLVYSYI